MVLCRGRELLLTFLLMAMDLHLGAADSRHEVPSTMMDVDSNSEVTVKTERSNCDHVGHDSKSERNGAFEELEESPVYFSEQGISSDRGYITVGNTVEVESDSSHDRRSGSFMLPTSNENSQTQHPSINSYSATRESSTCSSALREGEISAPSSSEGSSTSDSEMCLSTTNRLVNTEDAMKYLDAVRCRYIWQPEVYSGFLDIMKGVRDNTVDFLTVVRRVNELFRDSPDLIMGFSVFLPERERFALTNQSLLKQAEQSSQIPLVSNVGKNEFDKKYPLLEESRNRGFGVIVCNPPSFDSRVTLQNTSNSSVRSVSSVTSMHSSHVATSDNHSQSLATTPIQRAFTSPHLQVLTESAAQGHIQYQPFSSHHHDQIQNYEDLVITSGQQLEYQQAIHYVNTIKNRLSPEKYRQFFDILHRYQKQQKFPESGQTLTDQEFYMKISQLFEGHVDLLEEFLRYVPVSSNVIAPVISMHHQLSDQVKSIGTTAMKDISNDPSNEQKSTPRKSGAKAVTTIDKKRNTSRPTKKLLKSAKKSGKLDKNNLDIEGFTVFINKVQKLLAPPRYQDFLRVLVLYDKDILSPSEVVHAVGDLLVGYPEVFEWFKVFVECGLDRTKTKGSELSKTNPSENTNGKKSNNEQSDEDENIMEIDPNECMRLGHSYWHVKKTYKRPKCSGRTRLCDEVLNDVWVSAPQWTESVVNITKKVHYYEDLMFRIEEERFECDFVIQTNVEAIKYWDAVNRQMGLMSDEELQSFNLDDCINSRSTVHFRAINRIYGELAGAKIIEGLKRNPAVTVPVVLRRLKQKDEEWRKVQKECNEIWHDQTRRYYLKSLDHQCIRFKQADTKLVRPKNLIDEMQAKKKPQKADRDHCNN